VLDEQPPGHSQADDAEHADAKIDDDHAERDHQMLGVWCVVDEPDRAGPDYQ
jgi:hypothetical protein